MKKITIFIVMLFISVSVFAQGNGFIKATHTNNIDTEKRDQKIFQWDVMGRFLVGNNLYLFGNTNGNDTLYNTLAGISFKPNNYLRFEIGGGAEFLQINGESERQINPAFIFRGYMGNNTDRVWVNVISGTRTWWQARYIHEFNSWLGGGFIAEDKKGGGLSVELSPITFGKTKILLFSNAFYNGENPNEKMGFNLVVDIGASLVF